MSAPKAEEKAPAAGEKRKPGFLTPSSVREWSTGDVGKWLRTLSLPEAYASLFAGNDVDGEALLQLDKNDLQQLGVTSVGHRSRLVNAINDLRASNGLSAVSTCKRIAIEGNIAAGKSTFLGILGRDVDFVVVPEPVSKWQNIVSEEDAQTGSQVAGGNLLQMFYEDPARWGYTFQSYAFVSRMRAQMQPVTFFERPDGPQASPARKRRKHRSAPQVQFFERSVYSDRYCFALNCAEQETFNEVEWNTYCDTHTWLTESFSSLRLDGMIYLRTKPETCLGRLQRRARSEESTVSVDYLRSIHDKHETWLMDEEYDDPVANTVKGIPKLVIEADLEFERDSKRCDEMLELVNKFVKGL